MAQQSDVVVPSILQARGGQFIHPVAWLLCRGVYKNHQAQRSVDQPRWILVIGALGICFGLAMYGYKLIRVSVSDGDVPYILKSCADRVGSPFQLILHKT